MAGLGHWYVEIQKQAFWRGKPHVWVNRYVMNGADPTASQATAVINGLKAIENVVFPVTGAGAGVGFVKGQAYASTGGPPIAEVGYNASLAAGTATGFAGPTGGYAGLSFGAQLESCLGVVVPLNGLSSTGKPVTLRKYFRGITGGTEGANETGIPAADLTKIATSTNSWVTGVGGTAYVVCGTSGRLSTGAPTAQTFLVNHQVPRGRKRKSTAASRAAAYSAGVVDGAALAGASGDTSGTDSRTPLYYGTSTGEVPFP